MSAPQGYSFEPPPYPYPNGGGGTNGSMPAPPPYSYDSPGPDYNPSGQQNQPFNYAGGGRGQQLFQAPVQIVAPNVVFYTPVSRVVEIRPQVVMQTPTPTPMSRPMANTGGTCCECNCAPPPCLAIGTLLYYLSLMI